MSRIEKLAIQGIRSFGPDDSRKIEFYTPLTLILGQNGCGKTTIIESLKYISTGEFPPGCVRGGSSFVHDPKVAKEPVVLGQIKLLFNSTRGERIVCMRSLEVTQKSSKLECKSLDATITHTGPDGTKTSVSSKCADFQAEMTSLLGVSKPILENVIFCHQEEANWPLDEGMKVKTKFDAIFNATKYIKCQKNMKELRTEMKLKVRGMEETIDALLSTKQQADRLRKEFECVETQETNITEEQNTLKENLLPLRKRLKEISDLERNHGVIEGELGGKRHQLLSVRTIQNELKDGQNESFACSDAELFQMNLDFERNVQNQERQLQKHEESSQRLESDINNMKRQEARALQLMGQLEAGHKNHLDNASKRNTLLKDLVSTHEIISYMDFENFDSDEAEDILSEMTKVINVANIKIQTQKRDFEDKEATVQKEMDKLRSEEAALEQNIHTHTKQLELLYINLRQTKQNLMRNESFLSTVNINELRSDIVRIGKEIELEEKRLDTQKIDKEVLGKKNEMKEIERKLDDVKQKLAKMNKQAEVRSRHEINLKTKKELEQKVQFLKRKNSDDFQSFFGNSSMDNLRNELDAQLSSIKKQISALSNKKANNTQKKTELELKITTDKSTITQKENEIKEFEDKLQDICQGSDLNGAIEKISTQLDKLGRMEADKTCSTAVLQGYIEKLTDEDCCPLCHRDFQKREETEQLKEDLEQKLLQIPDHLSKVKVNLQRHKRTHEQLLQLKPQEKRTKLAKDEVQELKTRVKNYYAELEIVNNDLEEDINSLDFLLSEEEIGRKIQPDVITIDGHLKKIKDLTEEISDTQSTLGSFEYDMTMDELIKVQAQHESEMKTIRRDIEKKQDEVMQHKEKLQRLREKKVKLSTKEMELSTKKLEAEKLQDECTRLETEKSRLEEEIDASRMTIAPLKHQMKEQESRKRKMIIEKENWINAESRMVDKIRDEGRVASDRHENVKAYINSRREEELVTSREQVKTLQDQSHSQEEKRKDIQMQVNEIHKKLTNQKERKRNLEDERKIRDKETESILLEGKIKILRDRIKGFNCDDLMAEKDTLLREDSRNRKQRDTLEGRLEELNNRKTELLNNLNSKGIRNAEKNYKEKFVEAKCIDVACSDLNKYCMALHRAVMKFHSEKMTTINKIIRELWRTTYKGNDIDYIEMKTDASEVKGADTRQTYNYRVIMIKNDAEMDMRGRCSAGQKVLASLIIRMALAETFSSNCGILALDEPTTNLDRENIESLSLALLNIVNKRSHQKNFQLIIITHDEEFLHGLTRADFIEYYHRVSRNERGLSVITRHEVTHG